VILNLSPKSILSPPDINRYRGNTGIDYVTTLESQQPGPHVLLTALVHGNELCGAIALDYLFREEVRPRRGRLTLVFANVAAFERFDPVNPIASRFVDEDFNRVWSPERLESRERSVELDRARALRPVVDSADFLLDLHSMQNDSPPLMLCGPLKKGQHFACEIGAPEIIVADEGHAAGTRMRDYGGFGDPQSPKNALLVECGQHQDPISGEAAKDISLRFLAALDMLEAGFLAGHKLGPAQRQKVIEVTHAVTVTGNSFSFVADYRGLEVIPERGTEIGRDGSKKVTTPYDNCVLIMPSRRLTRGQTAVRLGRYID
jgi:predicted deacylase